MIPDMLQEALLDTFCALPLARLGGPVQVCWTGISKCKSSTKQEINVRARIRLIWLAVVRT